ncbi:MAG: hypothetical protein AAF487_14600 [Bacteroidota bacterium]
MEVTYSKYRSNNTRVIPMNNEKEMNVSFEINESGEIENISLDTMLTEENIEAAMQTINQIKTWMPLNEIGNRCKIKLSLPVTF